MIAAVAMGTLAAGGVAMIGLANAVRTVRSVRGRRTR
jgi:hypothetical protein